MTETIPAPASPAEHAYLAALNGAPISESLKLLAETPCADRVTIRIQVLRGLIENLKRDGIKDRAWDVTIRRLRHELAILGGTE